MRRLVFSAALGAAALGCGCWSRVGSGDQPTPTESLTHVLNSTQYYQRLGRLAAAEPLPFVGTVAFAAGPADSVVGSATAHTPLLSAPLTGPAYLVSHGNAAFPDLTIVLQGSGITLILVGNTDIKKGVTISTFNSVPDAPVESFALSLPAGPHSALTANANLCTSSKKVRRRVTRRVHGRRVRVLRKVTVKRRVSLAMPTLITGQNGAVIKQATKISVAGCPKSAVSKGRHRAKHRARKG